MNFPEVNGEDFLLLNRLTRDMVSLIIETWRLLIHIHNSMYAILKQ